ncbi:hypothetical protein A2716_00530 [candidate division WWE3 bacterium RIFCSPHIGHO2_01_FULL_40_23]|uniref:Putative 3-methyladenine DNA glycosylase n=1 Tax=candidate division WWE3 bacterium RIFCSPLOWO2_01_FULL_41_18 TaxID=1802625 RepID=A0A1F4VEW6_UNCKA|nr:MAG: hypothetical protein A2716_00530 [candidate division WWE3 bacterium RIFCSPHIGHO2_01_FULL_40_23]OGC55480.1 MAG: hypothetical protein A3A78_00800 [candidate division WWE3 bacterium RIFCSPLOWO2_01_FULL_41_18]
MKRLKREFYSRDTLTVARELLGKFLYKDGLVGKIVETEAYIGTEDKACHARWRKKEICFPMWGPAGFTYVYLTYGMYFMLNIVTEKEGFPSAVLIRAIEPIQGISVMSKNRGLNDMSFPRLPALLAGKWESKLLKIIASGPGKLTRALGINKSHNNHDLINSGSFYVGEGDKDNFVTGTSKRMGISYAEEYEHKPWRFYIKDNPFVSKQKG